MFLVRRSHSYRQYAGMKQYGGMEKTIAESLGIQYTKAYDFKYL